MPLARDDDGIEDCGALAGVGMADKESSLKKRTSIYIRPTSATGNRKRLFLGYTATQVIAWQGSDFPKGV